MRIAINCESGRPLVEQVVDGIRGLIDKGILRMGMKAESIRVFAKQHRLSAHTVAEAYERLVALGYFESRQRSGFFVKASPIYKARHERVVPIERAFDHLWQFRSQMEDVEGADNVSSGKLPQDWLDHDLIKSSLKSLAAKADPSLVHYGDPFGYLPLRVLLQSRLSDLGIHAEIDQILLTIGASHATDIVINHLLQRKDKVMVDDPGYFNLYNKLQLYGIDSLPVKRNADGPDLDMVETYARERRPAIMFTQSVLQTPTGSTIAPGVAHRLLRLAEQYGFRIVENDVYSEMMGGPANRLATLDQLSRVLYVGSFSKTLSGAARVGFIVADKNLIQGMSNIKLITSITNSQLDERLVFHALTERRYRKAVQQLRSRLADAIRTSCAAFEDRGLQLFCQPAGGKFLWLRHPRHEDSEIISQRALQQGLMLAPGKVFRPKLQMTPWFRVNVAYGAHPGLLTFLDSLNEFRESV